MNASTRAGRTFAAAAAAAALLLLPAAPATAAVTCSYDAATDTVSVAMPDAESNAVLHRSGNAIAVGGVACGAATVTNTDLIVATGSDGSQSIDVSLAGGPFAPGTTPEGSGVSEIEIQINAGAGSDSLGVTGSGGNDFIRLGTMGTNLNDDADADLTTTGNEYVTLYSGSGGNDRLFANGGGGTGGVYRSRVTIYGSNGEDTLKGGSGDDNLFGDADDDDLDGGAGNDALGGGDHDDMLVGALGDDRLTGDMGDDRQYGGPGTDTFPGTATPDGADRIHGGDGPRDVVFYSLRTNDLNISRNDIAGDGDVATNENDNVSPTVEQLFSGGGSDVLGGTPYEDLVFGGEGDDTIGGGAADDSIIGEAGADIINGSTGADFIRGNDDNDAISGGDDDDNIEGNEGEDTLNGGEDADTLRGGNGNDILRGMGGRDSFPAEPFLDGADDVDGGTGVDSYSYSGRLLGVTADLDSTADDGQTGAAEGDRLRSTIENLAGSQGDDVLVGNSLQNVLDGLQGADDLNGSSGDDILNGSNGEDTLRGGDGTDVANGDNDADVFRMIDGGRDYAYGGAGADSGTFDPIDFKDNIP